MKYIVVLMFVLFAGCCSCSKLSSIDVAKMQKAIKLADQIEMNDYKLVATNSTLMLIKSK